MATQATTHSFRRFMAEGFNGQRATAYDWETHLKTMFPEARLAGTLEVRGADSVPLPYAVALAALWTAVLYDDAALTAVEESFVPFGHDAWTAPPAPASPPRGCIHPSVRRQSARCSGRCSRWPSRPSAGALLDGSGQDERRYLDPLLPLVADDRSVTDALLDGWSPDQPDALALLMARCEF